MLADHQLDEDIRTALTARLKSIEGQARGIQRMLDEGRSCQAVIEQLAAMRAASHAVTVEAVSAFARQCLVRADETPETVISRMIDIMAKLTK